MALKAPARPQDNPSPKKSLSYTIQIDSDRDALSWVMVAVPLTPNEKYASIFDQVERCQFGDVAVWVLVKGDPMNRTFLRMVAEGYINNHQAWQRVDLSKF